MPAQNTVLTAELVDDNGEESASVTDANGLIVTCTTQFTLATGDSITVNTDTDLTVKELKIYEEANDEKGDLLSTLVAPNPGQYIMDGEGWAVCQEDTVYLEHAGEAEDSYWFSIVFTTASGGEVVWDPDVHEVKPT